MPYTRPTHQDVTIEDVAKAVGVSTRTVSRVVRDEGGYSDDTAARVRAAIDEMGYFPNFLARGMARGRTGTVGIIGSNSADPFFPELTEGVQRAAFEHHLTLLSANHGNDPERQREVLRTFKSFGVEGVVLFPAPGTEDDIRRFADFGLRTVVVDLALQGQNLTSVSSDIEAGARLAVEHLQATGRKHLAMIAPPTKSRRREPTFRSVAQATAEPVVAYAPTTPEGGGQAARELLQHHPEVDGIFAYNDVMAIGALRALLEEGKAVPDDIALVGFDDIAFCAQFTPSLTTVKLDRERVGAEAVRLVVAMADHPDDVPEPVSLPVELIRRESA